MSHLVVLTDDAARDIEELYDYIAAHDSMDSALYVLGRLEEIVLELAELPQRGNYPKELLALGIKEFREVHFKPYRIVYRVFDDSVAVMLIVDGRRDLQPVLQRRLLEG